MRRPNLPVLEISYTLFPTAIGPCDLAWTARGLTWLQLPERSPERTRARLLANRTRAVEATPPDWVADAIGRISRHLLGSVEDLDGIPLDTAGEPPFFRRVYEATRAIGRGQIKSYAEVARAAGSPLATRAVGQALAKNPIAIVIPCHRVVASGGKPGGFSASGGLDTKERLLALEGASLGKAR